MDGPFGVASRTTRAQRRWQFIAAIFIAVGVTAALSSALWWIFRSSPAVTTTRFAVMLGEGQRFASQSRHVTISPDGRQLGSYANDQLYVRSMWQTSWPVRFRAHNRR